jgi:hypothetical protein
VGISWWGQLARYDVVGGQLQETVSSTYVNIWADKPSLDVELKLNYPTADLFEGVPSFQNYTDVVNFEGVNYGMGYPPNGKSLYDYGTYGLYSNDVLISTTWLDDGCCKGSAISAIPEPATIGMVALGIGSLIWFKRFFTV